MHNPFHYRIVMKMKLHPNMSLRPFLNQNHNHNHNLHHNHHSHKLHLVGVLGLVEDKRKQEWMEFDSLFNSVVGLVG
jgi:hypothetical protein